MNIYTYWNYYAPPLDDFNKTIKSRDIYLRPHLTSNFDNLPLALNKMLERIPDQYYGLIVRFKLDCQKIKDLLCSNRLIKPTEYYLYKVNRASVSGYSVAEIFRH